MNIKQGHPKGLYLLFATETAERFSYYGMRALLTLYLVAVFFTKDVASQIYGSYTGLVYLTPLLGGYIADRYWGNRRSVIVGALIMALGQFLMFLSASTAQQSVFELGGSIDHSVDNSLSITLLFAGLAALIVGNGFFKPCLATMIGDLYDENDQRRDSAFTIYYMGVNVGAFIAPIVCGAVGEGSWDDLSPFKWGFLAACIAMLLSLSAFILFKNKLLVRPDGTAIGLKPKKKAETDEAVAPASKKNSVWTVVALVLPVVAYWLLGNIDTFTDYISSAIYIVSIVLPCTILVGGGLTSDEKKRVCVIYIITLFVVFFWSAYEQAGTALTYFANEQIDRNFFGWEMPASWFQSINPVFVVAFAPLMAMLWSWLGSKGIEPSPVVKQAIGLILLATGFVVLALGVNGVSAGAKLSIFWLVGLYFMHAIGELALSPIGQSLVNRLSPRRMASLLMGVWFMSSAVSNILAGTLATLYPETVDGQLVAKHFLGFAIESMSDFCMIFVGMAGIAAVVLLLLSPMINKLMK